MTVCIDTNVLLGIFASKHANRPILEAWLSGAFQWAVTTEILLEYEEIMLRQGNAAKAAKMLQIMQMGGSLNNNLLFVSPGFRFHTIPGDADDDKFADCAISAHADYVITADRHFRPLSGAGYKPQPIAPEEFIRLHLAVPPRP